MQSNALEKRRGKLNVNRTMNGATQQKLNTEQDDHNIKT